MSEDYKILIAEEDDGHYQLIKQNFKRIGIDNETVRFSDGQEIIDYLFEDGSKISKESQKHLLLLDINMPKVDGIEVLKKIKDNSELSKTHVIMLTTSNDDEKTQYCRDLGCTAYVVKPIEYESFVATIASLAFSFQLF